MQLPFRFEMFQGRPIKIRDDGRRGQAVADEWILWEVWQESLVAIQALQVENERLLKMVEEATAKRGRK